MKLVRFGSAGSERPAILSPAGQLHDLGAVLEDWTGKAFSQENLDRISQIPFADLPLASETERIGPPVAQPGKIVCVGLNYQDHAREMALNPTPEPRLFMKAPSSLSGPFDPIEIPRGSSSTDWEVELGVVIGDDAKYVKEEEAFRHVAGYVLANDISERDFQINHSGQWTKGKSHDSFCPLGPWLVTKDEIPNPENLSITLSVNDEIKQNSTTSRLIFGIAKIVSYISNFMTLQSGDLILTGTPAGVGLGQKPTPQFLKSGDRMTLEIEGLGQQKLTCQDA